MHGHTPAVLLGFLFCVPALADSLLAGRITDESGAGKSYRCVWGVDGAGRAGTLRYQFRY